MKKTSVEVELYEKDDKVRTADGEGVVVKDEIFDIRESQRFVVVKFVKLFNEPYSYKKKLNRPYRIHPLSCELLK